tara:strand:+ start:805 stop:2331 length:1527 start_codon:yes stop_codon:yes gene_type:complete
MRTTQIINHGKDGNLEAQEILLMAEGSGLKIIYGKLMAMFLKQGIMIERMYLQIQGNSLTLAIHGSNGNVLYMELPNHFYEQKVNFPVKGDFLLEGKADGYLYQKVIKDHVSDESRNGILGLVSQRLRGGRYGNQTFTGEDVQNKGSGNLYANVGISTLTLPIIWERNKGSLLHIKGLVTDSNNSTNNRRASTLVTTSLRSSPIPLEIPNMFHIEQSGSGYGVGTISAVNLICSHNKSIVKDALPKNLDLGNMAFLYQLPIGTISSIIAKGNKKKPFGELLVCYNLTGDEENVVCRVVNSTVSDGTKTDASVETKNLAELGRLIYANTGSRGVSTVSYSTWFDIVQTARSGTLSFATFPSSIEGEVCELIGVSNNGDIVYGLKNPHITVFTTISTLGQGIQFTDELLELLPEDTKKRSKKIVKVYDDKLTQALAERKNKPRLLKRLNTLIAKLNSSNDYKKWKAVSDTECEKLKQPKEYELEAVFLLYLKSTETIVTLEDVAEFNKLK